MWQSLTSAEIMQQVCGSFDTPPVGSSADYIEQPYRRVCQTCTQLDANMRPTAGKVLRVLKGQAKLE